MSLAVSLLLHYVRRLTRAACGALVGLTQPAAAFSSNFGATFEAYRFLHVKSEHIRERCITKFPNVSNKVLFQTISRLQIFPIYIAFITLTLVLVSRFIIDYILFFRLTRIVDQDRARFNNTYSTLPTNGSTRATSVCKCTV
jgi:hypothetical protein